MTVKEMIKELKKLPQNAKIAGFISDENYSGAMREVSTLYYDKEENYVDVSPMDDDELIHRN